MISLLPDISPEQRCIFTIIVPIFETTDFLLYHLAALREQTEQRWEAIYGFDGELPSQFEEFSDDYPEDPRIRIIRKGKPKTIGDLFNSCLNAARGENIIILHAEDSFDDSNILSKLAKEIDTQPTHDYCYFIVRHNEPDTDPLDPIAPSPLYDAEHPHDQIPHRMTELDYLFYPRETLYYLYKRSTITRHNLQFPQSNTPHLHEQFSQAYAQHVEVFTSANNDIYSTFEPFTFPPAMEEED